MQLPIWQEMQYIKVFDNNSTKFQWMNLLWYTHLNSNAKAALFA